MKMWFVAFLVVSLISCSKNGPEKIGETPKKGITPPVPPIALQYAKQETPVYSGRLAQTMLALGKKGEQMTVRATVPVLSANVNFEAAVDSGKITGAGEIVMNTEPPEGPPPCTPGKVTFSRPSNLADAWHLRFPLVGNEAACRKLNEDLSREGFDVSFGKAVRLRVFPLANSLPTKFADPNVDINKNPVTATGVITSLPQLDLENGMAVVGLQNLDSATGITSLRWDEAKEILFAPEFKVCKVSKTRVLPIDRGHQAFLIVELEKGALANEACRQELDKNLAGPLKLTFKNLVALMTVKDPDGKPVLAGTNVKEASLDLKPRTKVTNPVPALNAPFTAAYAASNGKAAKDLAPISCEEEKGPRGTLLSMKFRTGTKALELAVPAIAVPDAAVRVIPVHLAQVAESTPIDEEKVWVSFETGELMVKKAPADRDLPVLYVSLPMGYVVPRRQCNVFYYVTSTKQVAGRFDCQNMVRFDPETGGVPVDASGTFSCQLK